MFLHTVIYAGPVRNRVLVLGYLAVFFIVVQTRDALPENDWLVALVAAALMSLGLLLWVFVAQNPPPRQSDRHNPTSDD